MSKSSLKKKVLCSLLAASVFGVMYNPGAEAARLNGQEVGNEITHGSVFQENVNSGKFVIGQGNVSIQTNAYVNQIKNKYESTLQGLVSDYMKQESISDPSKIPADVLTGFQIKSLRVALAPVESDENYTPIVGVVGGEANLGNTVDTLKGILSDKEALEKLEKLGIGEDVINKIINIHSTDASNFVGNINVTVGTAGENSPVVIGLMGGDMAVGALLDKVDLTRDGNVNIAVNSGNLLGGVGGSVAVGIAGVAETTLNGNVNVDVTGGSNIGGFAGGGLAGVFGGQATSTVNGDVNININTYGDRETGAIDGLTAGVAGGGVAAAVAGTAESVVNGNTSIKLSGNGTALGIIGSGVAFATEYGSNDASASASTGKTNIVVDLDTANLDKSVLVAAVGSGNAADMVGHGAAVGVIGGGAAIANTSNTNNTAEITSSVTNAGADINLVNGYVVGTFGGGIAAATNFADASSVTEGDININVGSGAEAIGVFGNGLAYFTGTYKDRVEDLSGKANVSADKININVAGMADGIFANGIAIDDSQSNKINASVNADTAQINIYGDATVTAISYENLGDGAYVQAVDKVAGNVAIAGGGLAIGGGAENKVTNTEINIFGGTVKDDILAGGVAVHGDTGVDGAYNGGSYVENSTINLFGGTVEGDIYAGGASGQFASAAGSGDDYDGAVSKVTNSVINLAGTDVQGKIYGVGYNYVKDSDTKEFDYSVNSTLNVIGENTLEAVTTGSKISGFDSINFAADSVTKIEGLTANNNTALIDGQLEEGKKSVITVADSARLDISGLEKGNDQNGNTYFVADNYDTDNSSLWSDAQLAYDRTEGYAVTSDENGDYKVTYKDLSDLSEEEQKDAVDDAVDSFGRFGGSARGIIEGIVRDGMTADETTSNAGAIDFISDLTSSDNQADAEQGLYTGMMIGEDSGVTSNAVSMAQDFADNSSLRLSFTQETVNADKVGEEGGVWAKYLHNKHEVNGMNSSFGALNSSSSYDGVMVGAELAKKGNMQAGIAFAYGEGDGNGLTTKNDFDMWGISLYGNVKNDDLNIIGDIGFSKSSNEITGKVLNNEFNTDRDLNIFTMGVRAEKLYTNGNTQIVPYAGLRYMSVDADSYSTAYKDGKAFDYDAERQDIWTLPVGVSLRNETVTNSGWTITPKVDLAYIWAFGDTDNNVTVNAGSRYDDVLGYDVMDSGSWLASVGVDAGKGDWSYGLSYTLQKGSDIENNKWFVNVNYSF